MTSRAPPPHAPGEETFDLDRIWLRFRNPAVEETFSYDTLKKSINFIRAYFIAGTALYLLFGLLDKLVAGNSTYTLWIIRYGIVSPILIGIFALTFLPIFMRHAQAFLTAALATAGLGVVAMTAVMEPPFNSQYYAGLIMVVIYCGSIIRLRFVNSIIASICLLIAYQFVCLIINPLPAANVVSNNFFLVMATGVGLFSSYVQETYIRRAYIAQKIIEGKNELTKTLLQEAMQANRSKSEFLATMSHELRTPLNAIIGFSDILKKQLFGPLGNDRYSEYVKDIHASGAHLLAIINDILDLAKAEAGKLNLKEQEIDIARLLMNCVRMCGTQAAASGVNLSFAGSGRSVYTLVDERLFRQVILNLISNSIKFTPQGGQINLELDADNRNGVQITVVDTGIGIPQRDLDRILRPFEQVESALSRRHGGTGLGLPFAERLVKLHGGTFKLDSIVGNGTTVTIQLPPGRLIRIEEAPALQEAV